MLCTIFLKNKGIVSFPTTRRIFEKNFQSTTRLPALLQALENHSCEYSSSGLNLHWKKNANERLFGEKIGANNDDDRNKRGHKNFGHGRPRPMSWYGVFYTSTLLIAMTASLINPKWVKEMFKVEAKSVAE